MKIIRSRDNPLFKLLSRLATSSRERRNTHVTLLDGIHLIETYAASGCRAKIVVLKESLCHRPDLSRLARQCPSDEAVMLADALFDSVSQVASPVGIMAVVRTPTPSPMPETIGDALLLEEIQDPGNLGSILRSAAAAGVHRIFLSKKSLFAWSPKVLRAGMGAHFQLDIQEEVDLVDALKRCSGRKVVTMVNCETSLYDLDLIGPVAWIFGNEGAGVSAGLARAAHEQVRIPMPGNSESLNIAAAAAVCLFEQVRQRSG